MEEISDGDGVVPQSNKNQNAPPLLIPVLSVSAEHTRDRLNWSNYMRFVLNELGLEKDAFTYREYAVLLFNEASTVELPFTPGL